MKFIFENSKCMSADHFTPFKGLTQSPKFQWNLLKGDIPYALEMTCLNFNTRKG